MPHATFLNLSAAKRDQFLDAAFREFSAHDYRSASVSRIVARLGIAKGSVYQYFRDKRELYGYLLEQAAERKLSYIRERALIAGEAPGFYELHRGIILAAAEFDLGNPKYSLLILNAMKERAGSEQGAFVLEMQRRTMAFLRDYVRRGVLSRAVRADVDEELVVTLVNAASLAVGPYMEAKHGFSLMARLEHPRRPLPFGDGELRAAVESLVELLRRGIEPGTR